MKKTLIAMLALGGVAAADVVTVSPSESFSASGQDIAYGFILSLSDTFMSSSAQLGDTFTLASVSLPCSGGGGEYASSCKLAIFERLGNDSAGAFVGLSANTAHAGTSGEATVYDFGSITLDTHKQYQFLFVNSDTSADIFSTTEGNQAALYQVAAKTRFDKFNAQSIPQGDGIFWDKPENTFSGWSGQNMAYVTLTSVDTPLVPEPATATLGLLALAALAVRRRRS